MAQEDVRRAELWRGEVADSLKAHQQHMANYAQAHPIRAFFGDAYLRDARETISRLEASVREHEQELQRCRDHLQALSRDSAMLQRAQNQAEVHNQRIDEAREDVSRLELELHKQQPGHAYDIEVNAQQCAIERELRGGPQRGRGLELDF